jgi:hypothetical protein
MPFDSFQLTTKRRGRCSLDSMSPGIIWIFSGIIQLFLKKIQHARWLSTAIQEYLLPSNILRRVSEMHLWPGIIWHWYIPNFISSLASSPQKWLHSGVSIENLSCSESSSRFRIKSGWSSAFSPRFPKICKVVDVQANSSHYFGELQHIWIYFAMGEWTVFIG